MGENLFKDEKILKNLNSITSEGRIFIKFSPKFLTKLNIRVNVLFRVQQCRIYTGDKEVHPVHSMLNNELCTDSRIGTEFIRKVLKLLHVSS